MKIYLVESIDSNALERLKGNEFTTNKEEAEIVITRNLKIDKDFIDQAPNLKCVAIHGTGVSDCDLEYLKSKKITVFNAPYQNFESVAELALCLALMASRRVNKDIEAPSTYFLGTDLYKKKAFVLGYGHIGKRIKEILEGAFKMEVMVYSKTPRENVEYTDLDTGLSKSDYVFLAMSLNEETYHFMNEKRVQTMKDDAILVNVARGDLVDETAIIKALEENHLAYYASDVFSKEPLTKTNPLLTDKVIALPHIGSNTEDSLRKVGNLMVDGILDFIMGKTPKYTL